MPKATSSRRLARAPAAGRRRSRASSCWRTGRSSRTKPPALVAGQAVGIVVGVGDAVRQGGDAVEAVGHAVAVGVDDPRQVAAVQDVQAVVLGEHRERVLEQPAGVVLEAGLLAVAGRVVEGEQLAGLHRGDEHLPVARADRHGRGHDAVLAGDGLRPREGDRPVAGPLQRPRLGVGNVQRLARPRAGPGGPAAGRTASAAVTVPSRSGVSRTETTSPSIAAFGLARRGGGRQPEARQRPRPHDRRPARAGSRSVEALAPDARPCRRGGSGASPRPRPRRPGTAARERSRTPSARRS